jgi:hypothetical protein
VQARLAEVCFFLDNLIGNFGRRNLHLINSVAVRPKQVANRNLRNLFMARRPDDNACQWKARFPVLHHQPEGYMLRHHGAALQIAHSRDCLILKMIHKPLFALCREFGML